MPIECSLPMRCFGQEEFHDVDHCVTGLSFEVHNDLGRFFDERVYRDALANRCEEAGFSARREVVVRVSHKDFVKDYYLDLVIADGVLYELKTSDALVPTHEKQLINYLLLTDQRHGALLNFRTASVQKRFVSTTLTREKRQDVNIKREQWDSSGPDSRRCLEILAELLADWGAFLDVGLYHEAVLHNLGGGRKLECVTKVETGNGPAIPYRFHILDGKAILHVSAATRYLDSYQKHLSRMVARTQLEAVHWINFNKRNIMATTVKNPNKNNSAMHYSAIARSQRTSIC